MTNPHSRVENFEDSLQQVERAGSRLIAALGEEAALSARFRRDPTNKELFGRLVTARQSVEQCREEYAVSVDLRIRSFDEE